VAAIAKWMRRAGPPRCGHFDRTIGPSSDCIHLRTLRCCIRMWYVKLYVSHVLVSLWYVARYCRQHLRRSALFVRSSSYSSTSTFMSGSRRRLAQFWYASGNSTLVQQQQACPHGDWPVGPHYLSPMARKMLPGLHVQK
jgi:hypothetical protein